MRIFVVYQGDRVTIDVGENDTVRDITDVVRDCFSIGSDQGVDGQERKILTLHHSGCDLDENWVMGDVGICTGSTVKALMKDEITPILYIYSVFNGETTPILDKLNVFQITVAELRAIATRKTGIPVGVFRLVSPSGEEMFDCHPLHKYDVQPDDHIRLETWDGWNDFLFLAAKGITSHVMAHLSSDEVMAKYQMKVALYIAAHFGHVDLAVALVKHGIRPDEPIGDHPTRLWCRTEDVMHIDSLKAPVHEASEMGQLGVLRSFVIQNVCTVLAKDGNQLTPLNIALRKKQKPCASFLLTKQWSKINYTSKTAVPLNIFCKMKRWADRAKDKVLIIHGQWKSSVKNPKRLIQANALVGYGVLLDGFSETKMTGKSMEEVREEEKEEARRKKRLQVYRDAWKINASESGMDPEAYFRSINSVKVPRLPRIGRMLGKAVNEELAAREDARSDGRSTSSGGPSPDASPQTARKTLRPRSKDSQADRVVKLPSITEKFKASKGLSLSHQNLSSGTKQEPEFNTSEPNTARSVTGRAIYLQTGKTTSVPSIHEEDEPDETYTEPEKEKKTKKVKVKRPLLLKKTQTSDGGISLPMLSSEYIPRPFVMAKGENPTLKTLQHYERIRGLSSREYAIKCLAVANSFKEKPWLHQVRQAMTIATTGVKKTVANLPHLFTQDIRGAGGGSVRGVGNDRSDTASEPASVTTTV